MGTLTSLISAERKMKKGTKAEKISGMHSWKLPAAAAEGPDKGWLFAGPGTGEEELAKTVKVGATLAALSNRVLEFMLLRKLSKAYCRITISGL